MPLHGLVTTAEFRPLLDRAPDAPLVTVRPAWRRKAQAAAELMLREHLPTASGGELVLSGQAQPGLGLGSSTSDVTATLRAVADCYGLRLPAAEIAALAVRAEGASDSVMVEDRVVLFAHRSGRILEEFDSRLPGMLVVGCDTDPARGGVDTLAFRPPEHTPAEVASFRVLVGLLRHALATRSVALLAQVAQASARINQRYLPTRGFATLCRTAREAGGLGVQVSHSGTVAGVIYDAGRPDAERQAGRCVRLLRRRGFADPQILTVTSAGALV
jgi:uncharacterized protein involved in propanediol utilization